MKIKNFLLVILPAFSLYLFPQSPEGLAINDEFLNSLPDFAREELLEQINSQQADLKDVDFGVFSTILDEKKADKFIEQELLKNKVTKEKYQLLLDELEPFGKEFFAGFPTTFMPISEPSLSSNYILDIGDILNISVFGNIDIKAKDFVLMPDGSVNLPEIGRIVVAGLSLNEANSKINSEIATKFPGSEASIALKELRSMQVVIIGFVENPGIYTVAGNSSILSAIKAAGGISNSGSYRNITLSRAGKVIQNIDLYDLFIKGDSSFNKSLKSGDVINISSLNKQVSIYGGVARPAKYELINETLSDVVTLAGGFTFPTDSINTVSLSTVDGSQKLVTSIEIDSIDDYSLKNLDVIFVPFLHNLSSSAVELKGAFINPGTYSANEINSRNKNFLFSNVAHKSILVKKERIKNSTFKFSFHQPDNIKVNPGDSLIALSNLDIDFLQSTLLKNYFNQTLKDNINRCELFVYLDNLKDSTRFQTLSDMYQRTKTFKLDVVDNSEDIQNNELTQIQESPFGPSSNRVVWSQDLFIKRDAELLNCNALYDEDPELFIAILLNSVNIDGGAIKGGIYPVGINSKVSDVLNSVTYLSDDEVSFVEVSSGDDTRNISKASFGTTEIRPGDNISIASDARPENNFVFLQGEVHKPGKYFISGNERLSDVIRRAGGYKSTAYPTGGLLLRQSAVVLEKMYNQRLYNQLIRGLASELVKGQNIPFDSISYVFNELNSISPQGRVITEFNLGILDSNKSMDAILEKGDRIILPKRTNTIYVLGEVLSPGQQIFESDTNVFDAIERAGGFTSDVDKSAIILVYPDGKSKLITKGFFGNNFELVPGSVIYATRDFKKLENIRLASTLAPIVSSIAISLASLNSISND